MKTTRELLQHAESLPIEDRAMLVDALLQTLNPTDSAIDRQWAETAARRLAELRRGNIKATPASAVFAKARGLAQP